MIKHYETTKNTFRKRKLNIKHIAVYSIFILLLTQFQSLTAVAQQQTNKSISGKVVDGSGIPLPGVTIVAKGTTIGVITDASGNYKFEIPSSIKFLVFSFIGMETQELAINNKTQLNVTMSENSTTLDEVIATGYSTVKKSAFAGSASVVKMAERADIPTNDFKSLLQGSAPGVQLSSSSGALGASTNVTIRGLGSFNASTSPLYVIDGVPVMTSISSGQSGGTDIMSTINVSDIENVTVIKDAAAASLYGSRAANGVIVITTKTGKNGKASFNAKADWGFSQYATDYRPVMGGPERRETFWEGLYNQALYLNNKTETQAKEYADANIDDWAPQPKKGTPLTEWTDWENELFNNSAPYENYEFSASKGDKKSSFYTSLSYNNQDGIVRQQNLERFTGRLNVKYKMTDKLQLGANILFSRIKQFGSNEGTTYTSPLYSSRHKVSASDYIYELDGSYNTNLLENGERNPKSALDFNYKRQLIDRSFNTVFANYTIIDGLIFNTTLSLDHTNSEYKSWTDPRSTDGMNNNGSLSNNFYQYDQMVWKNNLTYNKTLNNVHNLDAIIGYEAHEYKRKYISGTKENFPNVDKEQISNGSVTTDLSGSGDNGWRLISYLGNVNYNYDNKYYLGLSARTDASSRLYTNSRWGTFWSVSGAWRVSSEEFMNNISNSLSDLRLRASYGTNGTLPSGFYGYMDLVSFGYEYNSKPGILETQIGNKNLKWEKNYNLNLGIDFRLFNKIGATVEYYKRQTSDLLMDMDLSLVTGFSSILTNVGEVQNTGFEVDINANIIEKNNFSWTSSMNFGQNKNKIIDLGGQEQIVGSYTIRNVVQSYYQYYLKDFAGINPETGYPQYYINDPKNLNDRSVTENAGKANYITYKSPDPKLSGGWTNNLKYKLFDLNFLFTYTLGGYSYDRGAQKLEHAGKSEKGAIQALYRDRWKKPGDITNIEMFMVGNPYSMASVINSRRIHSSDHLRLKNLTFGFSLPKEIVRKANLENVRLFFSGTNLLTWAAYDGYDPEIPRNGIYYFETPKMKTYTFGVDIKL